MERELGANTIAGSEEESLEHGRGAHSTEMPAIEQPTESPSRLNELERHLGAHWSNINASRALAQKTRARLISDLAKTKIDSEDTSVVINGSLARDEFTEGSDIDWTLLIDGSADPTHLDLTRKIEDIVANVVRKKPGREGIFGNMTFSHEIIHRIGGEDDTNKNTTRRILLLLESDVVGRSDAYKRVCKNILYRYIREDLGFRHGSPKFHVPRFLLNDFARYWRTMAVDFAYKQRNRFGEGWAIRNIKLRMSRKLIYVSGLLTCFSFQLGFDNASGPVLFEPSTEPQKSIEWLWTLLDHTPLEILAGTLLRYNHLEPTARKLFDAYDAFLGMLADKKIRDHLQNLPPESDADEKYQYGRDLSHKFRDGLLELFFDDKAGLSELTKMYGVF